MIKPEWVQAIAAIAMAIATVVLVGVTIWYARNTQKMVEIERDRDLRRPQLDMTASTRPPDCFLQKVYTEDGRGHHDNPNREPLRDWAGCCWLRALVSNKGTVSAERVEVYITELHRDENGSYVRVSSFAPRRLVWANAPRTSESRGQSVLPNLHPGVDQYCDVGRIVDPRMERWRFFKDRWYEARFHDKPILELCVDRDGPPFDHALEPGRYRVVFMLSCADNLPLRKEMHLHFTGAWYEEERMLGQGVTLELVDHTVGPDS